MSLDRAELETAIAAHGTVTRVVITGFAGSAPRETGAAMLVWQTGQSGTIGGGALEHQASNRARALLPDQTPHLRQTLALPLGPALGQCCGGMVRLLLERLSATELAAIPVSGLYARPLSSGTAETPLAVSRALRLARSGMPHAPALDHNWFIEPMAAPVTPLWLYGAGHVGRAIARVFEGLPFQLHWIDTDRTRFPEDLPTHATILAAANPADVVGYAADNAIHVVLTYSHALDLELCHRILSRPFGQLHLIGSATKRARFAHRLRALGHADAAIARIVCPLGVKSLGKEPGAIAVGLAAALLAVQARPAESVLNGERTG